MYAVIKKSRLYNLSIECQLDLFDKMVVPVLLYGCEIWGFSNCNMIEKIQLKFCKLLLHVKRSTPNFFVYGELYRFPLIIAIKTRIISYWADLIVGKESKYSSTLYNLLYMKHINGINFNWITRVKTILEECGMSYIWSSQTFCSKPWLVKSVKQILCDQFLQKWISDCNTSSKGLSYNLFMLSNFEFPYYLTSSLSCENKIILSKFRSSNHRLPIETGRWQNVPRENRLCHLCFNDIGDEYHYILSCNVLSDIRTKYIPFYFRHNPNTIKFYHLFATKKLSVLKNLCTFITIIYERVSPPG